jgi:hypothetical protein
MPIVTTSQVLTDGGRNVAMQFTGYSDDGGGETNAVKVDVSELTPKCNIVKPTKIEYDVKGGALKLSWAGVPNEDFLILSGQGELDYSMVGSLRNGNTEANGDILFSTLDWGLKSSYSVTIFMVKSY